MNLLPGKRLIALVLVLALAGILNPLYPGFRLFWWGAALLLGLGALYDAWRLLRLPAADITRELPGSLPLGRWREVWLTFDNPRGPALELEWIDHHPEGFQVEQASGGLRVPASGHARARYRIRPLLRGAHAFLQVQTRLYSPWRLWQRDRIDTVRNETRVYPDFAAIAHYALLATASHTHHIGIRQTRQRGEGTEFHQLREFREGDALRQIDWKATMRLQKPITREFQDERDQQIFCLLDCGYRMLTQDGELSHFDHCLNAVLLLAFVASRQGDALGIGTFGGVDRWLSPAKGRGNINRLLNAFYDIQPTRHAADFQRAATELVRRQRKRSLVIILSNLREEDSGELLTATRLLSRRHSVLIANLREQILDDIVEQPVENFHDAVTMASAQRYKQQRGDFLRRLAGHQINLLDTTPRGLTIGLINRYLRLKAERVI